MPEARIDEHLMTIPGTDGQKMSKSYGNIIDLFLPEKKLKKNVMGIITDSTPLEEPKDPDICNVFNIYKTIANEEQIAQMRKNYTGGNFGYGHAKTELFELLLTNFSEERKLYNHYMDNEEELERALIEGENKAKDIAQAVLTRARKNIGY